MGFDKTKRSLEMSSLDLDLCDLYVNISKDINQAPSWCKNAYLTTVFYRIIQSTNWISVIYSYMQYKKFLIAALHQKWSLKYAS